MSQGSVICVHDKMSSLQIHSPFDQSVHDGEGLLLMCCVISFMGVHLAGGECDRLWSLALILHENCTKGFSGASGPNEGNILVCDVGQWGGDLGISFDESSVVVAKT